VKSQMTPLPLEQAYRDGCRAGLFDLSSSAPVPYSMRDLIRDDAAGLDGLLDTRLEYGPVGGDGDIREVIASLYDDFSAADVLVTAGASEGIRAVSMAVVRPGDKVVVQSPTYPGLSAAPDDLGAETIEWTHRGDFQFDLADLAAPAFAGASAVFLNTPHGPSGTMLHSAYDGRARLIADEVYRPIELVPGTKPRSLVERDDTAVSIGDLSKPLGLGGLRIGWIASRDRALLDQCAAALDRLSGSVSTVSARLALGAIRQFDTLIAPQLARAGRNLSTLGRFIDSHAEWLDWSPPQAGYTAFVRFRCGDPGPEFYEELRRRGVFLLGGDVFGEPGYARVGFGVESERFEAALAAFGEEVRRLPTTLCASPDGDVIVLAKEPRPGFTKTRLAASVGVEAAARLSDIFLQRTLSFAQKHARRLFVSFAPDDARESFQARAPGARLLPQPQGDLGHRLLCAFEMALADGGLSPVLIGSDSPTVPPNLLRSAQRLLASHDVVLGPAEDGGYYLIGMNEPQPALFQGINWSEDVVLAQTLQHAASAGLCVATLPYWYDIDTADDLARLEGAL
jgi:rSAM/selenodomain-associated transferase 1